MRELPHVLGIVLAGGEGKRLYPLTADRAKPAVPFGGAYRLIFDASGGKFQGNVKLRQAALYAVDHEATRFYACNPELNGVVTLPATFTPGPRLGPRQRPY